MTTRGHQSLITWQDQLLVPYAAAGYTRLFYREDLKGQGTCRNNGNTIPDRMGRYSHTALLFQSRRND